MGEGQRGVTETAWGHQGAERMGKADRRGGRLRGGGMGGQGEVRKERLRGDGEG